MRIPGPPGIDLANEADHGIREHPPTMDLYNRELLAFLGQFD